MDQEVLALPTLPSCTVLSNTSWLLDLLPYSVHPRTDSAQACLEYGTDLRPLHIVHEL